MLSGTVSAGLANGLIAFAERHGGRAADLLEAAGLNAAHMVDPDSRVPLDGYVRLIDAAKALTDSPALPLLWAEAVGMAELSIVGLVMESSATMGEAFLQLQRYGRLAMDASGAMPQFALAHADGKLFMEARGATPIGGDDLIEAAFVRLVCGPRKFLQQPHVLSVRLTREAPSFRLEYERIFRCPVEFGAETNALELHPDVAGWPITPASGYLADLLSKRAELLLSDLDARTSWRRQTEQVLASSLHEGPPSVEQVARQLGFSRQTLFRRLRQENTTFARVLDELRETLAKGHMSDGRLGITETAFVLGFVESASFTRAFRRWTGATPSEFMKSRKTSF